MKNVKLFFLTIAIFVATINLTSCLNVVRDIKINSDGSGKETLTVEFGSDFMGMLVAFASIGDSTNEQGIVDSLYNDEIFIQDTKEKYSNMPGVTLLDIFSTTNPDSSKTMKVIYSFDEVSVIGSSFKMESKNLPESNTTITYEEKEDKIYFKYFYESKEDEVTVESDSADVSYKESFAKFFEGDKLVFNIEFDYDIISSNANNTDGRKLTWEINLSDIYTMEGPLVLEAVLQK